MLEKFIFKFFGVVKFLEWRNLFWHALGHKIIFSTSNPCMLYTNTNRSEIFYYIIKSRIENGVWKSNHFEILSSFVSDFINYINFKMAIICFKFGEITKNLKSFLIVKNIFTSPEPGLQNGRFSIFSPFWSFFLKGLQTWICSVDNLESIGI